MQARIRQLETMDNYKDVLKSSCKANGINCKLLNGLTLRKIEKIYNRTLTQYLTRYLATKIVQKEPRQSGLRTSCDCSNGLWS